jgi:hypothetical protein
MGKFLKIKDRTLIAGLKESPAGLYLLQLLATESTRRIGEGNSYVIISYAKIIHNYFIFNQITYNNVECIDLQNEFTINQYQNINDIY